jgi:hypothetical protein
MKQKELTVWKDGMEWFTFPEANEQNVMDMLMQKGHMQSCVILPHGEQPRQIRTVEMKQPAYTEQPKTALPPSPKKTVKRKPIRK